MKVKVIGCSIFKWFCEKGPIEYDYVFMDIAQHDHPAILNQTLQQEINASQQYDIIILLYGVCGNAVVGLSSKHTPILLFRAHDCSAVLLGSNQKQLNQRWSCFSLWESKKEISPSIEQLEQQYGEHAQYLYEMLYQDKELAYIDFQDDRDREACNKLKQEGYQITQMYQGTDEIIKKMLNLEQHPMILKINKDKKIKCVYDLEVILKDE